jgi:hypothetical protein
VLAGRRQVLQEAETDGGALAGLGHAGQAREIPTHLPRDAAQQIQALLLLATGGACLGAVTLGQRQLGFDAREVHSLPGVQNAARPPGRVYLLVSHRSPLLIGPIPPVCRKMRYFLVNVTVNYPKL